VGESSDPPHARIAGTASTIAEKVVRRMLRKILTRLVPATVPAPVWPSRYAQNRTLAACTSFSTSQIADCAR
jgi:hypothetical protein